MLPILVAYGTTEGQTRKIAEFIAERLRARGHRVDLVDTAGAAAGQVSGAYQAAILGGSLHERKHQDSLRRFIDENRPWLAALPCAFFSVSLTAALDDLDSRIEVQRLLDDFIVGCGLRPLVTRRVAGALKYTQYSYFKREVMRMISRHYGRTQDTSSDHEYTDWADVGAFVDEFLAAVRRHTAAGTVPVPDTAP